MKNKLLPTIFCMMFSPLCVSQTSNQVPISNLTTLSQITIGEDCENLKLLVNLVSDNPTEIPAEDAPSNVNCEREGWVETVVPDGKSGLYTVASLTPHKKVWRVTTYITGRTSGSARVTNLYERFGNPVLEDSFQDRFDTSPYVSRMAWSSKNPNPKSSVQVHVNLKCETSVPRRFEKYCESQEYKRTKDNWTQRLAALKGIVTVFDSTGSPPSDGRMLAMGGSSSIEMFDAAYHAKAKSSMANTKRLLQQLENNRKERLEIDGIPKF